MTLLEVKSISKSYTADVLAVDHVSLAINRGEIICLLGPSGCGKTTLLRLIAGLELPDSGEVWFDGHNMAQVPPHQRDFGMMFQDFALFPHKNVAENIAFGLQMHSQTKDEIAGRVEEMLDLVALNGYGDRDVTQLSGGEQQRVALARSLAPEPRLLMLDEPLGALDRALRERLMLDLRRILKQVGVTAVYVTHDQTEAFAVSDRVALMNAGKIEQLDNPQNVYYQPATQFAARFLGFRNLLPAVVTGPKQVQTVLGELEVIDTNHLEGANITLLIRPEAALVLLSTADSPTYNVFNATVLDTSFRGRYSQVWVEASGQRLVFELSGGPFKAGSDTKLFIDPQATNILPA
jgi:ABC-type Fe3+/spermidine/putrescine transport system ATPase subunit